MDYELKNSEPQAYQALQQAKSPEQAAQVFSNLYERPGKPMMNERIKHSRNAMTAYSMGQAGSMAAGPATPSGMPDISQLDMGQAIKAPDVSQLDMGQAVQGPEEKSIGQQITEKALSYVPSLSAPETWNWKPAAQYGGMALGGALGGLAAGPMGAAAGGTLGYGMGNEAYNLLTGNQPPLNTLPEVAQHTGEVLKEGAKNALMAESAVPAISKVAQIAGKVIKPTLGRLSGTGTKAIEKSLEGSPDFVKGLKGELSGEDIVQNARDAVGVVRNSRSLDYLDKFKTIANMPNEIDITPVKEKMADLMKSFRVKVMPDGKLNFGTMAVNDAGRSDIKELIDTVNNWDDLTPAGADALKRYVGDFYSDSSQARAFVTPLRQSINNLLAKEIPGYHEMTKTYAQQTQLINEIEKGLSLKKAELGGKATADQTLRRLMSAMRDNFKLRGDLLESLSSESGTDIAAQVAGHAMSSIMPYGLGGSAPAIGLEIASTIWHPKLAALFISSSPKVQGEFLRYWGKSLAELESLSPLAKKGLGYGSTSYAESLLRKKGETPSPSLQPAFQY